MTKTSFDADADVYVPESPRRGNRKGPPMAYVPEQRSLPRSEEDLIVAANAQHVLAFDNLSGIPEWLSDAISRLSTGGGAGKRRLYTDDDEAIFAGRRLVCLNGIEDVAVKPDLIERAVMLALEPLAENKRRDEAAHEKSMARALPGVFGALLDGVASGLRHLPTTELTWKPRMIDFALWAEACGRAYWPAGTFLWAYQENAATAVELVLEASAVGDAVRQFMAQRTHWEGTATALLPLLTPLVSDQTARDRGWPKQPHTLTNRLRRVAPALRKIGIHVTFDRTSGERSIYIERRGADKSNRASLASPSVMDPHGRGNGDGQNDAYDADDGNDSHLHLSAGPTSDFDAIMEELRSRGEEQ